MSTSASKLSGAQLANLIGELSVGRNPAWYEQTPGDLQTSPPRTGSDGVDLTNAFDGGAVLTQVQVRVRRVAAYRTVVFEITVANSDTYSIEFAGAGTPFATPVTINYVSDGTATAQEIAEGLKAAIEANGTLTANLLAYAEKDPDTGVYRLRVTGKPGSTLDSKDFEIDTAGAAGSGDLTVSADPMSCTVYLWAHPGGIRASTSEDEDVASYAAFADSDASDPHEETSPWLGFPCMADGSNFTELNSMGALFRFDSAGYSRICAQVKDVASTDGVTVDLFNPRVIVGPCHRESQRPSGT